MRVTRRRSRRAVGGAAPWIVLAGQTLAFGSSARSTGWLWLKTTIDSAGKKGAMDPCDPRNPRPICDVQRMRWLRGRNEPNVAPSAAC